MRIPAAGTVPWRVRGRTLEVALVHRARYDDWSWPKGKLEPGEGWAVAAARETAEETGMEVRLGPPLPRVTYTVLNRDGGPDLKEVRYWAARAIGGSGRLDHEVDEVAWLDVKAAHARLDYAHDRDQLLALVRLHQADRLDTWPLVLVRHAHAVPRSRWDGGDDTRRPLDRLGRRQARALVPLLRGYGIRRVVTSPSARCADTIGPFATSVGIRPRERHSLSEEAFDIDPAGAQRLVLRHLERSEPVALCTHGPVLPALLDVLSPMVAGPGAGSPGADPVAELAAARAERLVKGEALVIQVLGTGPDAVATSVERHLPRRVVT